MEETYELKILVKKQAEIFTGGELYGMFIPVDAPDDREFLRVKMSRLIRRDNGEFSGKEAE